MNKLKQLNPTDHSPFRKYELTSCMLKMFLVYVSTYISYKHRRNSNKTPAAVYNFFDGFCFLITKNL